MACMLSFRTRYHRRLQLRTQYSYPSQYKSDVKLSIDCTNALAMHPSNACVPSCSHALKYVDR